MDDVGSKPDDGQVFNVAPVESGASCGGLSGFSPKYNVGFSGTPMDNVGFSDAEHVYESVAESPVYENASVSCPTKAKLEKLTKHSRNVDAVVKRTDKRSSGPIGGDKRTAIGDGGGVDVEKKQRFSGELPRFSGELSVEKKRHSSGEAGLQGVERYRRLSSVEGPGTAFGQSSIDRQQHSTSVPIDDLIDMGDERGVSRPISTAREEVRDGIVEGRKKHHRSKRKKPEKSAGRLEKRNSMSDVPSGRRQKGGSSCDLTDGRGREGGLNSGEGVGYSTSRLKSAGSMSNLNSSNTNLNKSSSKSNLHSSNANLNSSRTNLNGSNTNLNSSTNYNAPSRSSKLRHSSSDVIRHNQQSVGRNLSSSRHMSASNSNISKGHVSGSYTNLNGQASKSSSGAFSGGANPLSGGRNYAHGSYNAISTSKYSPNGTLTSPNASSPTFNSHYSPNQTSPNQTYSSNYLDASDPPTANLSKPAKHVSSKKDSPRHDTSFISDSRNTSRNSTKDGRSSSKDTRQNSTGNFGAATRNSSRNSAAESTKRHSMSELPSTGVPTTATSRNAGKQRQRLPSQCEIEDRHRRSSKSQEEPPLEWGSKRHSMSDMPQNVTLSANSTQNPSNRESNPRDVHIYENLLDSDSLNFPSNEIARRGDPTNHVRRNGSLSVVPNPSSYPSQNFPSINPSERNASLNLGSNASQQHSSSLSPNSRHASSSELGSSAQRTNSSLGSVPALERTFSSTDLMRFPSVENEANSRLDFLISGKKC